MQLSDEQVMRFIDDPVTEAIIASASEVFKDVIVNTRPSDIENREEAYHMYHATMALKATIARYKNEIISKNSHTEFDNDRI